MKAIVYTKYGPPEVLQLKEIDKPTPKKDEVLVRVYATTVNRTDCATVRAKPFFMRLVTGLFRPHKSITGTDFAGKIESVGEDVISLKVGDKVFGFDDVGLESHAEYLTLSEHEALLTLPENMSYKQAAASSEGTHYAYNFINKVNLERNQRVLVNGATGAIGSAEVQLLKYFGANVTAVCATKHIELVKSLGADKVIDYTKEDFTQDEQKYSFVFDTVGKSSFAKCKPILESGGVYISSELGWMYQNLYYSFFTSFIGNKKVKFPVPVDIKRSLRLVKKLTVKGKFKAVIDREYTLEKIVDAFNYVESGQKIGNVVITMKHDKKT